MEIEFITIDRGGEVPPGTRDAFLIQSDGWNDYNNYVRFDLTWCDQSGDPVYVGKIKILEGSGDGKAWSTASRTSPPERFSSDIGERYISLGQSEHYYRWMRSTFGDRAESILRALRDIAVLPGMAHKFEPSAAFRNGMMRQTFAYRSRRFGAAWARGESPVETLAFSYLYSPNSNADSLRLNFDFDGLDILPGRVVGIIGRNAVGKTRLLTQLSADLAQIGRQSAGSIDERESRFPLARPLFTRVLAVSYSAFDSFRRPPTDSESTYIYCGIRDDSGRLSQSGLQRKFAANRRRVRSLGRHYEWIEHITDILGDAGELTKDTLLKEIEVSTEESALLERLSSGQAILCHVVTGLLAWLEPESLVLFDEPETHLHPNAVANLFAILGSMLSKYQSYAILATHSPLVIQEIPSKRVVVLARENGETSAEAMTLESFGESVAELTEHVFSTHEAASPYKTVLDEIAASMSLEAGLQLFQNPLGMNAKSYLLGRLQQEGKN